MILLMYNVQKFVEFPTYLCHNLWHKKCLLFKECSALRKLGDIYLVVLFSYPDDTWFTEITHICWFCQPAALRMTKKIQRLHFKPSYLGLISGLNIFWFVGINFNCATANINIICPINKKIFFFIMKDFIFSKSIPWNLRSY